MTCPSPETFRASSMPVCRHSTWPTFGQALYIALGHRAWLPHEPCRQGAPGLRVGDPVCTIPARHGAVASCRDDDRCWHPGLPIVGSCCHQTFSQAIHTRISGCPFTLPSFIVLLFLPLSEPGSWNPAAARNVPRQLGCFEEDRGVVPRSRHPE